MLAFGIAKYCVLVAVGIEDDCATVSLVWSPGEPKDEGKKIRQMENKLLATTERFSSAFERSGAPGACGAMIRGAESCAVEVGERHAGGGEPMTLATHFPISCVIKPMVAMACFAVEQRGLIDLSAPVETYLPELGGHEGRVSVTVRQLLTHTGGYVEPRDPNARWTMTWPRFAEQFRARVQAFAPGAAWSYTHTGYVILAQILERVTGSQAKDVLDELVVRPLGLTLGSFTDPAPGAVVTALHIHSPRSRRYEAMRQPSDTGFFRYSLSDLTLSVADVLRFGRFLAGDPKLDHSVDPQLRPRLLQQAVTVPGLCSERPFETIPTRFHHGIGQFGELVGVNGSFVGSTLALRIDQARGIVAVVAINAWLPLLREQLIALLAAGGRRPEPPARNAAPHVAPEALVGDYEALMLGSGPARIDRDGDGYACWTATRGGMVKAALLARDAEGGLRISPVVPGFALGVFKPAEARDHALMIGSSAYRRVASLH